MGEHSYKHVSWMKWRLHLGGITPQWFQLKLYRLDWSLWASELVLAVQQALSFQGEHCNRARDRLVRVGRQELQEGRGCCRCWLPAEPTARSLQQPEDFIFFSELLVTLGSGVQHCSKAELEGEQEIRSSAGISASLRNRNKPPFPPPGAWGRARRISNTEREQRRVSLHHPFPCCALGYLSFRRGLRRGGTELTNPHTTAPTLAIC